MNVNFSVALCDHVDRFTQSPSAFVPIKCVPTGCTHPLLGPRIVEWKQRTDFSLQPPRYPEPFSPTKIKEEAMITRFHGIDSHKNYSTISVLGRQGKKIDFKLRCSDLKAYIRILDKEMQ